MQTPADLAFVLALVLPPLAVVLAAGTAILSSLIGRWSNAGERPAKPGTAPLHPASR